MMMMIVIIIIVVEYTVGGGVLLRLVGSKDVRIGDIRFGSCIVASSAAAPRGI
jgi:hypothetical protein